MAIAADNMIVRMNVPVWMRVILRMRVGVCMMRPSILSCIGQRSSCRFRYAWFPGSTITENLLTWHCTDSSRPELRTPGPVFAT
jgi:hypothetical protein